MVLVDTPGIKKKDDVDNSQLFTHLRKASALIYIIKTENKGGTDKVVHVRVYGYKLYNAKNVFQIA